MRCARLVSILVLTSLASCGVNSEPLPAGTLPTAAVVSTKTTRQAAESLALATIRRERLNPAEYGIPKVSYSVVDGELRWNFTYSGKTIALDDCVIVVVHDLTGNVELLRCG
jgi:hypothetical protein